MAEPQRRIPQWTSATPSPIAGNDNKSHSNIEWFDAARHLPNSRLDDIENHFRVRKVHLVTLDKTPPGAAVRIVSMEGSDTVALRLMEMGITPGSAVRVIKSAPLGDPIQICVKNYHLALRRYEARAINVALCD
jgi:Fe2+ transport system protein FeoA